MNFLIFLLLCFTLQVRTAVKKMQVLWLNNGGQILSDSIDWIRFQIKTPNMNDTIACTQRRGYNFLPGDTRFFTNLWFPVENQFQITLKQYNLILKDDVAQGEAKINNNQTGYYHFRLSLSQFRKGQNAKISYEGKGNTLDSSSYTQYADYYMLLRLNDVQVANNTYGLDHSCKLWGYYLLVQLWLVAALLVWVI